MKKISILAFLLAALAVFSLSACTSDDEDKSDKKSKKDTAEETKVEVSTETEDLESIVNDKGSSGPAEIVNASDLQDLFDNMIVGD